MNIQSIENLAKSLFPNATEIHVSFSQHYVANYGTESIVNEGTCVCAMQGHDLNKQFSARSPIELAQKISDGKADWEDYHRFINPGIRQDGTEPV